MMVALEHDLAFDNPDATTAGAGPCDQSNREMGLRRPVAASGSQIAFKRYGQPDRDNVLDRPSGLPCDVLTVIDKTGHVIMRLPWESNPGGNDRRLRMIGEAERLFALACFAARNFQASEKRVGIAGHADHEAAQNENEVGMPYPSRRWSRTEMDAAVRAMLDSYAATCADLVREIETGLPVNDPYPAAKS